MNTGRKVITASDGVAAVDLNSWAHCGSSTPRAEEPQLINKPTRAAICGPYSENWMWTRWASLPKFRVGD